MPLNQKLARQLILTISETNGISIRDTLELLKSEDNQAIDPQVKKEVTEFHTLLGKFSLNQCRLPELLSHPVANALFEIFRRFPLKYKEDHIHLTGSLTAEFIYPRLKKLIEGPHKDIYQKKITEVYGPSAWPINSVQDVDKLIRLKDGEGFNTYLRILYLPKLILVDRQAHEESAYHLAKELYTKYNVGHIRLKFMLSRSSSSSTEQVPGADNVSAEDVVLGLYAGFAKFKVEYPDFSFVLSPSFRKEPGFFDSAKYPTRKDHFEAQVDEIVRLLDNYPFLSSHLVDVDTVGSENDHYRKGHFNEFQKGFRKLQYRGFSIRSHHGETFNTLRKGIQAVDNAMNIWHIDTLEHGLALGINPNFYFHRVYQKVMLKNKKAQAITSADPEYLELMDLDWGSYRPVLEQILRGEVLNEKDQVLFIKAKFHTAREVEHYQHDVLNRMIQKGVNLVTLPSSNNKLTGKIEDYKDHPFSWWEKKGVNLALGTDNYVTLNTSYVQEMLILLCTDAEDLKITKLLMVTTGENRRPYISHWLWKMRKIEF